MELTTTPSVEVAMGEESGAVALPGPDDPASAIEHWPLFWTSLSSVAPDHATAVNSLHTGYFSFVDRLIIWLTAHGSTEAGEVDDVSVEREPKRARLERGHELAGSERVSHPVDAVDWPPDLLVAIETVMVEKDNIARACAVLEKQAIVTVRELLQCRDLFGDLSAAWDALDMALTMFNERLPFPGSAASLGLLALIPVLKNSGEHLRALVAVLECYPRQPQQALKAWQVQSGRLPDQELLIRHQVNFEPPPADPEAVATGNTAATVPTGRSDALHDREIRNAEVSRLEDLITGTRALLNPVRSVLQDMIRTASRTHAVNLPDRHDFASYAKVIRQRTGKTNQARDKLRSECHTPMPDGKWRDEFVKPAEKALLQECAAYARVPQSWDVSSGRRRLPMAHTLLEIAELPWTVKRYRYAIRALVQRWADDSESPPVDDTLKHSHRLRDVRDALKRLDVTIIPSAKECMENLYYHDNAFSKLWQKLEENVKAARTAIELTCEQSQPAAAAALDKLCAEFQAVAIKLLPQLIDLWAPYVDRINGGKSWKQLRDLLIGFHEVGREPLDDEYAKIEYRLARWQLDRREMNSKARAATERTSQ